MSKTGPSRFILDRSFVPEGIVDCLVVRCRVDHGVSSSVVVVRGVQSIVELATALGRTPHGGAEDQTAFTAQKPTQIRT
jgi:hypothetical protein